jgi:Terminase large subunit, T4likevirus-type, N-terminal
MHHSTRLRYSGLPSRNSVCLLVTVLPCGALSSEFDQLTTRTPLERLRDDPANILHLSGLAPDSWQAEVLRSFEPRVLLLCSRQAGKSLTAAALALREALLESGSLTLLLSPTQRQAGELFKDKVLRLFRALGRPVPTIRPRDNATMLELQNGSRIIALPGEEETIRGYSNVGLIVIDEASRVPDALYSAVRPMLAVSRGKLVALSTPFGRRGWFFEEWQGKNPWKRVAIAAKDCPRITAEFLDEELQAIGPRWHRQEYGLSFEDTISSLFSWEELQAACQAGDNIQPEVLPE